MLLYDEATREPTILACIFQVDPERYWNGKGDCPAEQLQYSGREETIDEKAQRINDENCSHTYIKAPIHGEPTVCCDTPLNKSRTALTVEAVNLPRAPQIGDI